MALLLPASVAALAINWNVIATEWRLQRRARTRRRCVISFTACRKAATSGGVYAERYIDWAAGPPISCLEERDKRLQLDRFDSASAAFERAMAARHTVLDDLIEILAAQLRWR